MTKKQFKDLPFPGKVKFIIHKYGWEAIFVVYLVVLLGSWIYVDYVAEQPLLNVEMINGSKAAPEGEAFETFLTKEGYTFSPDQVEVSKAFQLGNDKGEYQCDMTPALLCKIGIGKTDLYFWDDQEMEEALAGMDLIDLRLVLPYEVLETCQDRLIYTAPLLAGGYPCGIRLTDCSWVEEHGFYQDCAVGISRNVQNRELVSAFIEYIL